MRTTIYQKHFTHPFFFFITLLFTTTSSFMLLPPTSPVHRTGKCTKKEREALLNFKSYIHHDPYGSLSTWTTREEEGKTSDCCHWSGVSCNNHSRVIGLDLFEGSLEGKISPSLLNLSYLSYLDLLYNSFNGTIPMFIGSMTQLRYLGLAGNDFSGTIPMFICSMTQLRYLDLGRNDFSGTIPSELGNLTNLQLLSLEYLSNCTIENLDWLSHLSQLEELVLSGTSLGKVNNWVNVISSLKKLSVLLLDDCDLSQVMHPYSYSYVNSSFSSSIVTLSLPENNLNSSMYYWLFPLTSNALAELYLSGNKLDGRVTDMFSNFDPFTSIIDLSSNNFYGHIPNVPSGLNMLDLSKNNLSGQIFFLCQIRNGSLSFLDLSHNAFTGPIPDCLWRFTELRVLSLGYNNLSGRLPSSINYLINLEVLYLYNNNFSGKLPLSLMNVTRLTFLNLGANKFSGYVPGWIGERLSGLYTLILTSNKFIGTIPSHLCQLVYLQILDLSMNKLQGTIPTCLSNLTSMVQDGFVNQNVHYGINGSGEYVDHSMIKWQGSLHEFGSILGLVKIINLSSNNLTGKIPDELTDLHKLIALDLSVNALVGEIPSKIGELKELQILDLSKNNLSGGLPSSMSQMTLLNYLDVSYNNLSGRIPSSTQLQSFEPSRYTRNAGLCGRPLSEYCPGDKELEGPPDTPENTDDKEGTNDLQRWFYIGGATGFITGFWMVCIALLVNRRGRRAFFHLMNSLEDWVYVNMMVFIAKLRRLSHS